MCQKLLSLAFKFCTFYLYINYISIKREEGLRVNIRITCISVWEPRRHGLVFLKHNKYRVFLKQVTIFPDASFAASLLVAFSQPWGKFSQLTRQ